MRTHTNSLIRKLFESLPLNATYSEGLKLSNTGGYDAISTYMQFMTLTYFLGLVPSRSRSLFGGIFELIIKESGHASSLSARAPRSFPSFPSRASRLSLAVACSPLSLGKVCEPLVYLFELFICFIYNRTKTCLMSVFAYCLTKKVKRFKMRLWCSKI